MALRSFPISQSERCSGRDGRIRLLASERPEFMFKLSAQAWLSDRGEGLNGSCMVGSEESCVLNSPTLLVNRNLVG